MSLIPWRSKQREGEPAETHPLVTLRNEMDRLFDTFVREPFGAIDWSFGGPAMWSPAVDVSETDKEVVVQVEVPGLDPKDLDVSIAGNQLVLSGEKKESEERKGKDYYRSEIRFGSFRRTVPLPERVDAENVDAQYANGVVTLRLQKTPSAAPKRIQIKTE